jgi:hypothetical protein
MALYAVRPEFIYGKGAAKKPYRQAGNVLEWFRQQTRRMICRDEALWAIALWMSHFLKREFETVFIHKVDSMVKVNAHS